jgi:Fe2+ or Zn2+ uptake regulation protein
MTELDKLEESEELNSFKTIPIFKQIKKENIIEGLYSFYKSLTTEEKTILNILFESKDPLSVRQIRKKIAIKIALENKEKVAKIPFISKKLEKFEWKHTEHFTFMVKPTLENVLPNLTDKETTMLVSFLNKISSSKVPSYYTITSILDFFEKQRLVAKRELVGRKAESVWYLSPVFLKILLYVVKAIKKKSNPSMIEQELLSMFEIKS